MSEDEKNIEEALNDAAYQAFIHAETDDEALRQIAFTAGVDLETAIANISFNAPDVVVRSTLRGVLLGMLDANRPDMILTTITSMAELAEKLGLTPDNT